ncbi:hypothetical protein PAXINDRAFT_17519 [Paxillus involutus ATCC 200175]|uniref:Uncharacterized protein n=1 Tax=Paxillus involutus ATCC 200175 TaxID=664439 RepID=A0A0C9TEJ6_PAXIN|nr:hypothetical protein PAXINDRAFT_17519 [Paxillus involutus ATCC 200175]
MPASTLPAPMARAPATPWAPAPMARAPMPVPTFATPVLVSDTLTAPAVGQSVAPQGHGSGRVQVPWVLQPAETGRPETAIEFVQWVRGQFVLRGPREGMEGGKVPACTSQSDVPTPKAGPNHRNVWGRMETAISTSAPVRASLSESPPAREGLEVDSPE